jgi:hypothetical protein
MRFSVAQAVLCGVNDAEVDRRAAAVGRVVGKEVIGEEVRPHAGVPQLAGRPDEIVEWLLRFAELGVDPVYFQILGYSEIDHLNGLIRSIKGVTAVGAPSCLAHSAALSSVYVSSDFSNATDQEAYRPRAPMRWRAKN